MKGKWKFKVLISLMVIVISVLHYTSGFAESPLHGFYRLLYFIPIIIGAFNFGFKGSVLVSLIVSSIYSPHLVLSLEFKIETLNEFLDIILFFAVGIITGTLVEKRNIAFLSLDNQLKQYIYLEKYTNSIIDSIKSGVVAVNNDMLITSMNPGAKVIFNIDNECIGQSFMDISYSFEGIKENINKAISENIIIENVEIDFKGQETEKSVKVSIFPLNFINTNKGLVIIFEDITQLKKIQKQVQRNDRLASVGQLATGIAHEIRNPLAIIKMIDQTMKIELKDNKEAVKELEIIDEEVERANKVIKSLMEFGKQNKDKREYSSLNTVIDEVLIIVNKYVTQHGVLVQVKKSEIPYSSLDKDELKQAFINIIFNAVDAMGTGGKLVITTNIDRNTWIKVSFEDNGAGIEEKDLEKIFNPFFTTKDEGTGLGLPIVHKIIEEHGGIINVNSEIGLGTTFEILFPINQEVNE
jgi:two-component system, sporulation sensor kinase E